jgi:hypothetical protein
VFISEKCSAVAGLRRTNQGDWQNITTKMRLSVAAPVTDQVRFEESSAAQPVIITDFEEEANCRTRDHYICMKQRTLRKLLKKVGVCRTQTTKALDKRTHGISVMITFLSHPTNTESRIQDYKVIKDTLMMLWLFRLSSTSFNQRSRSLS